MSDVNKKDIEGSRKFSGETGTLRRIIPTRQNFYFRSPIFAEIESPNLNLRSQRLREITEVTMETQSRCDGVNESRFV